MCFAAAIIVRLVDVKFFNRKTGLRIFNLKKSVLDIIMHVYRL